MHAARARRIPRALLAAAATAAVTSTAPAGAVDPEQRPESLPGSVHEDARRTRDAQSEKWREGEVELPPFPAESRLIALDTGASGGRFSVLVDPDSISVGEDWVHRYVVVLESSSGARNVFFEGVRCATDEARTYAYGRPKRREFEPLGGGWKPAARHGSRAYQAFLLDGIFCTSDTDRARPADEVRDVIERRAVAGAVGGSFAPPNPR